MKTEAVTGSVLLKKGIKKETTIQAGVFLLVLQVFKNSFFSERLRTTASVKS